MRADGQLAGTLHVRTGAVRGRSGALSGRAGALCGEGWKRAWGEELRRVTPECLLDVCRGEPTCVERMGLPEICQGTCLATDVLGAKAFGMRFGLVLKYP